MQHGAATRRLLIVGISLVFVFLGGVRLTHAANLQFVADYVIRQQGNQASGTTHDVFFQPATTMPLATNQVRLVFPVSPVGTWCRVAGNDLTVTPITDPPGFTEGAQPLPGAVIGGCTIGNGSTTFDTITVTNIGPLNAGTKYGFSLTDPGTTKLGTPPAALGIHETMVTNDGTVDVDALNFYTLTVPTDQVSVSAVVAETPPANPNPTVEFHGWSAASGQLTITRDGTTLVSVPTGTDATFDVTLTNQLTGQHIYVVSGVDRDGSPLVPLTFAVNLVDFETLVINQVFLGPTIARSPPAVTAGQSVTVVGNTAPNSTVTLTLSNQATASYDVVADSFGHYSKAIDTSGFASGTYNVKARAFVGGSTYSEYSATLSFTVSAPTSPPDTNTNTGTNGNTNTRPRPPTPRPPTIFLEADLNRDGHVDFIDFSIFLFYWGLTPPAQPKVDISNDNRIDIIDFSIFLAQWTG